MQWRVEDLEAQVKSDLQQSSRKLTSVARLLQCIILRSFVARTIARRSAKLEITGV